LSAMKIQHLLDEDCGGAVVLQLVTLLQGDEINIIRTIDCVWDTVC
jgi:hypothetical protein